MAQGVKLSYFGYTAVFGVAEGTPSATIRKEANERIIKKCGTAPKLTYVEPGLPFPDYVPVLHWDAEYQEFV